MRTSPRSGGRLNMYCEYILVTRGGGGGGLAFRLLSLGVGGGGCDFKKISFPPSFKKLETDKEGLYEFVSEIHCGAGWGGGGGD